MTERQLHRPLGALLALALCAGCGQRSGEDHATAARTGPALDQEQVGSAVGRESTRPAIVEDARLVAERIVSDVKGIADKLGGVASPAAGDPVAPMSDADIAALVRTMLAADPMLATLTIGVDAKAGVVTLTGRAPDAKAVHRALEVAANAKGVLRVENRLTTPGKS